MSARPLCPLVLFLLAIQPRRAHELAQALSTAPAGPARDRYPAVLATLDRLRDGGLVRRRVGAGTPLYQITRRGQAELRLHQLIWASLPVKVDVGP